MASWFRYFAICLRVQVSKQQYFNAVRTIVIRESFAKWKSLRMQSGRAKVWELNKYQLRDENFPEKLEPRSREFAGFRSGGVVSLCICISNGSKHSRNHQSLSVCLSIMILSGIGRRTTVSPPTYIVIIDIKFELNN